MLTPHEAQKYLSEQLPERIEIRYHHDNSFYGFFWKDQFKNGLPHILETEWQQIALWVEEKFIHKPSELQSMYFIKLRDRVYSTKHSGISIEPGMIHAPYATRATAMKEAGK